MRLRRSRRQTDESVGSLADGTVLRAAYDDHGGELFALAYRSLGDRGRAEEAVQETFLRAWRGADRYDPRRSTVRTWLYAICRNVVIDASRALAARPRLADAEPRTCRRRNDRSNNSSWDCSWRRRCDGCPISIGSCSWRSICAIVPPPRSRHNWAYPWAPSAVACTTG